MEGIRCNYIKYSFFEYIEKLTLFLLQLRNSCVNPLHRVIHMGRHIVWHEIIIFVVWPIMGRHIVWHEIFNLKNKGGNTFKNQLRNLGKMCVSMIVCKLFKI